MAMLKKSSEGKMEETVLWKKNHPGSLCYDPWRRNLYVVEVLKKTPSLRELRSIEDTRNQKRAEQISLWSTIMVGTFAECHDHNI